MAFGIKREELSEWKRKVNNGEIAFLTHFWEDPRFPGATSVTKVGCKDIHKLAKWGTKYGLKREWIHLTKYPHFDLFTDKQKHILYAENQIQQIERFNL